MKIGVGIIAWSRPEYFQQLINTLEKQSDLTDLDFHLFQDGVICQFRNIQLVDRDKINMVISIFQKSKLPNKVSHIREKNVGIAINQYEAKKFLSNNYQYFIFLEEDIILSLYFTVLAKIILKQFEKDSKIACVSPGFKLYCNENEIKQNLDKLITLDGHFWAEIMWSWKWKIIEKEYQIYYNLVKDAVYLQRKVGAIADMFQKSGHPMSATSQDQGKDWAIKMVGMKRLRMVVNRATGIGDYGVHGTLKKLSDFREGHNKIYSFKEELEISQFKIIE